MVKTTRESGMKQGKKAGHSIAIDFGFHSHSFFTKGMTHGPGRIKPERHRGTSLDTFDPEEADESGLLSSRATDGNGRATEPECGKTGSGLRGQPSAHPGANPPGPSAARNLRNIFRRVADAFGKFAGEALFRLIRPYTASRRPIFVISSALFSALEALAFFFVGAAVGANPGIAGGAFVDGLGGWRGRIVGGNGWRSTQVRPIDIGAQVFATDGARRFAFDIDGQLFTTGFPACDIAQVANRRFAALRKRFSLISGDRLKECFDIHAADYIHRLVVSPTPNRELFNTSWCGLIK